MAVEEQSSRLQGVQHPKPVPPVLYKYVSIETARAILSVGKYRFQSPLRYNDPLDSQWDAFWEVKKPEMRDRLRVRAEGVLSGKSHLPQGCTPEVRAKWTENVQKMGLIDNADEKTRRIDETVNSLAARRRPASIARKLLNMRRRLRFCCFSANPLQTVMWSHYAQEHRGIVLGFDTMELRAKQGWVVNSVQYKEEFPEVLTVNRFVDFLLFGVGKPDAEAHWQIAHLTKASEWEYEEEWRILGVVDDAELGDFEDMQFPKSPLKELILGSRTDQGRGRELFALGLGLNLSVQVRRTVAHESRFALEMRDVLEDQLLT